MSSRKATAPRRCCGRALGFGALALAVILGVPGGGVAQAEPASATAAPAGRSHGAATRQRQKKRPAKKDARSASQASGPKGKASARTAAGTTPRPAPGDGLPFSLARPSKVTPNQAGKIVIFPFRNDDAGAISTQVGQLLAARGLDVMSDVKPVDSAEQYRDMATALGLVAYVDGDVRGSQVASRATVRIRSGYSGRKMAEVSFKESRENLPREISDQLWAKLGPSVAHACVDAAKPRKKSRTLQINAGTPVETVPNPPRTRPSSADQAPGSAKGHSARIPDARPSAPRPAAASNEPERA
jgi:hypothetical protein